MSGLALMFGVIFTLGAVLLAVVIAVLLFRRRSASGGAGNRDVPPPVDPGPAEPEQARDVNADK